MSPRAAWRLEGFGFSEVYDYAPGKADWFAAGLPMEGGLASVPTVGDIARRDVPICAPAERVGEVRGRVQGTGWDRCMVVNEGRVVLGLLREKELASDPEATAEEAMRSGPTVRPDTPAGKMAERMQERGTASVVVTIPDGELVGLVYREDAEHMTDEQARTSENRLSKNTASSRIPQVLTYGVPEWYCHALYEKDRMLLLDPDVAPTAPRPPILRLVGRGNVAGSGGCTELLEVHRVERVPLPGGAFHG